MKTNQTAFTILELIIVIALIGIFIAGSTVFISLSNNSKTLEKDTKRIVDLLLLARSNAVANAVPFSPLPNPANGTCAQFKSYRIRYITTTKKYQLEVVCFPALDLQTGEGSGTETVTKIDDFTLSSSTIVKSSPDVEFSSTTGATAPTTIKLTDSSQTRCSVITVTAEGLVAENPITEDTTECAD